MENSVLLDYIFYIVTAISIYYIVVGAIDYLVSRKLNPSAEIVRISKNMVENHADFKSVKNTSNNALLKTSFGSKSSLIDKPDSSKLCVEYRTQKRVHGGGWGL